MAQDIKDLLDHLGWTDRSLHLFGVSLGGMQLQNLVTLPFYVDLLALTWANQSNGLSFLPSLSSAF
jgi:hypothetical protein